ncbi:hypothetical protein HYX03_04700 [Candidatus Woesearchaeota archaeon]|nr:hypothetical protein [Candidatus Woesearchaeota archaeon]
MAVVGPLPETTMDGLARIEPGGGIPNPQTVEDILVSSKLGSPRAALESLIEQQIGTPVHLFDSYQKFDPEIEQFAVFGRDGSASYIALLDVDGGGITFTFSDKGNQATHWPTKDFAAFAYFLSGLEQMTNYSRNGGLPLRRRLPTFDERLRWVFVTEMPNRETVSVAVYAGMNDRLERYVVLGNGDLPDQRTIKIENEPSLKYRMCGSCSYPGGWREIPLSGRSHTIRLINIINKMGYERAMRDEELRKSGFEAVDTTNFPPKKFLGHVIQPTLTSPSY